MVKKHNDEPSVSLTAAQRLEFTRIARQLVGSLEDRIPTDGWDPVSRLEETPVADQIPDGHIVVRGDFDSKPKVMDKQKAA